MSELEQTSLRLRYGSAQQRVAAWQKLVSLEEKGLDGEKVARSGLIPILVAMLEQSPSRRKTSVQNQAASLLMEAAGSDAGMELLVKLDCVPRLSTVLLSGSYIKRAKVTAILGMISLSNQRLQTQGQSCLYSSNATMLSTSTIPQIVKLLAAPVCVDPVCTAMMMGGLQAMLSGATPVDCFIKAGGLEVFSMLLVKLSCQASASALSSSLTDDDGNEAAQCEDDADMWLAAVAVVKQAAMFSSCGAHIIAQGPLLRILMQCCSSTCCHLQLLALTTLRTLAAVPQHGPAFVQAGQMFHLAIAMHSCSPAVQAQALSCIKLLVPVVNSHDEQLLVSALENVSGTVPDSNSVTGESLDSSSDDDDESNMEC